MFIFEYTTNFQHAILKISKIYLKINAKKSLKAFTVQPMLTPPEKNVDVNGIFEMTKKRIK